MHKSALPGGPYTRAELEALLPWITWSEPQKVSLFNDETTRFACPICVANKGLKGWEVQDLPTDPNLVRLHIALEHSD